MTSARRTSPKMNPSRRHSAEARQPRHVPRDRPVAPSTYTSPVSAMSHRNYDLVSSAPEYCSEVAQCWPPVTENFYPGNDSAYIPTSSVAPTDLTHSSYWETMSTYDVDVSSTSSSSGSVSSATTCISPPLSEAEILHPELYQTAPTHLGMDHFSQYADPWVNPTMMPPTPPADPLFDNLDLFNTGKNDPMAFVNLPDAAIPECEYLGVSQLQFSRAPVRHHQPRPIRSASERSPRSSIPGSPKDEPVERTKNNPRNDPRYDIKADKDGLYHCPYAGTEGCTHQPTKQKCIYAKNLDSHLKPYTCKHGAEDENCRSLRFSSNACLFRHEREMHGMHNHGINPYLCKFPGCERARHDNGFPRRWNQRDHMKRVHGWEEPENDNETGAAYADAPRRRKGPGASTSVAMKRTGSSRAQANYSYGPRTVSAPRYAAQLQRELQAHSIMIPGIAVDTVNYAPQHMVTQAYGTGSMYVQSAY